MAAASPGLPALARAASIAHQKRRRDHLLNQLSTVVRDPYVVGTVAPAAA